MTSGLRKVHKMSWILIAILGIIFLFFTLRSLSFDGNKTEGIKDVEITVNSNSWD
jgi:hypothetical protein